MINWWETVWAKATAGGKQCVYNVCTGERDEQTQEFGLLQVCILSEFYGTRSKLQKTTFFFAGQRLGGNSVATEMEHGRTRSNDYKKTMPIKKGYQKWVEARTQMGGKTEEEI